MSPSKLFDRLLDDAAMFPPGNADAATAITDHLKYRSGPLNRHVGPLLVHIDRWREVATAHAAAGSPTLEVVVLGTNELPRAVPGLHVVGFELPVPSLPLPDVPRGTTVACEITAGGAGLAVLEAIASSDQPLLGKFRTGGTTAEAFPDEETLAVVVVSSVRTGARMKYTAGLHHAVRFQDDATGFEHHGFLNLLVAVRGALAGASEGAVAGVLGERQGARLAADVGTWAPGDVDAVRRAFASFGCCGVEDPVADLVAMDLLALEDVA